MHAREHPYEFACRTGEVVVIDALGPGDGDAYRQFLERQCLESVYRRFFSGHRPVSPAEIARTLDGARPEHLVLGARLDGALVAVAELSCDRADDRAEVAFFIDDAWHHQGLATELLHALATRSRAWGYDHLDADSLGYNVDMMRVFDDAGYRVHKHLEQGVWTYRLELGEADRPR